MSRRALRHEYYCWIGTFRNHFSRMSRFDAKYVPGILNNSGLHAKAYAEEGYFVLTSILRSKDFPFCSSLAETSRNKNSIRTVNFGPGICMG
mmetsp:Transcript_3626/g.14552  ORF Transcript_3626/g.14552 Transcript_3626/m.14552 type:complete len:92 (-) Transcript_3626:1305-1580(-)